MDKRDEILEIIKKRLLNVPLHEEKRIVLAVDCVDKLVGHLMEWHESRLAPLRKVWEIIKDMKCKGDADVCSCHVWHNATGYYITTMWKAIKQVLGETEEGGEG